MITHSIKKATEKVPYITYTDRRNGTKKFILISESTKRLSTRSNQTFSITVRMNLSQGLSSNSTNPPTIEGNSEKISNMNHHHNNDEPNQHKQDHPIINFSLNTDLREPVKSTDDKIFDFDDHLDENDGSCDSFFDSQNSFDDFFI